MHTLNTRAFLLWQRTPAWPGKYLASDAKRGLPLEPLWVHTAPHTPRRKDEQFAWDRVVSRLFEMQSEEYKRAPHNPTVRPAARVAQHV